MQSTPKHDGTLTLAEGMPTHAGRPIVVHDDWLPAIGTGPRAQRKRGVPSMAMQSVLRSLAVLEAVAEHQPVRVGELTPLLGLPKSTVQRSLETLAEAGWLRQVDGDLTRWALTSRAQSVVLRSGGDADLREYALRPMQRLRDVAGETTHLFVPTGSYQVVVIERVDCRR